MGDFDLGGAGYFAIDALGEIVIGFDIGDFMGEVGFLFDPIEVKVKSMVAAGEILKVNEFAETVEEGADSLDIFVDVASDILSLDFDGDFFAADESGPVNLGD